MSGTFNRLLGDRRSSVELAKNSVTPRRTPNRARWEPRATPASLREQAQNRTEEARRTRFCVCSRAIPRPPGSCTRESGRESHAPGVNADVARLFDRNGGLATTAQLLTVMTRQQLDVQVRKGAVCCVSGTASIRASSQIYGAAWPRWTCSWARPPSHRWALPPRCTASTPRTRPRYTSSTRACGCGRQRVWWSTNGRAPRCSGSQAGARPLRRGRLWRSPGSWVGHGRWPRSTQLCARGGALRTSSNGRFVISADDAASSPCGACCRSRMRVRSRRWRAKPGS